MDEKGRPAGTRTTPSLINSALNKGRYSPVLAKTAGLAASKTRDRGVAEKRKHNMVTGDGTTTVMTNSSPCVSECLSTAPTTTAKPQPLPTRVLRDLFAESELGRNLLMLASEVVFPQPSQDVIDAYDLEVVNAIRKCDVSELREMRSRGKSFHACNRFGESLLHMACRRGDVGVLAFLVEEANVPLEVRDDFGRTPLHDACWTPEPNFEAMDLLLKFAPPHLLLAEDVRGHTPFDYARKEHWDAWAQYLRERSHLLPLGEAPRD